MDDVRPIKDLFIETTIGKEKTVSIVKMVFKLDQPVESNMFDYITDKE